MPPNNLSYHYQVDIVINKLKVARELKETAKQEAYYLKPCVVTHSHRTNTNLTNYQADVINVVLVPSTILLHGLKYKLL